MTGQSRIIAHDDRVVFGVQKSDIGLETIEGEEWWRECMTGEQYGWFEPKTKTMSGLSAFEDEQAAHLAGYRPVFERYKVLAKGVLLTAKSNELTISSDLWAPTFETRYRVMYTGLRLAMRKGIVRYRGDYSRHSRQAGEALRHRLKKHAHVKRYEHNLVLPPIIGDLLLSELAPFCEQDGRYTDTPSANVYIKGSLPKDKDSLKVHAYRLGKEYDILEGFTKLEVVLRKEALKTIAMRKVETWPTQPEIQGGIRKVLVRQWKAVFKMAPRALAQLMLFTGQSEATVFDYMANEEHTLSATIKRVEALEREQARQAREQARQAREQARHAREQARHAQRLAALEAKKHD